MRPAPHARLRKPFEALRADALARPEAHEDFPWGDRAFKVRKKVFAFIDANAKSLNLTVKLPHSADLALALPFVEPTGYGLGKSGWVSARFAPDDDVPLAMLLQWLDESYRAIAPKTLSKQLDAGPEPRKKAATKKKTACAGGTAKTPSKARKARPRART